MPPGVMQCAEGGEHSGGPPADHPAPPGALQACAQARHAHAHGPADAPPPAYAPSACAAAPAVMMALVKQVTALAGRLTV